MRRGMRVVACGLLAVLSIALLTAIGHAGLADALKKKVTDKVTKKAEDKTDQVLKTGEAKPAATAEAPEEPGPKQATGTGKVNSVSTKFDFVPGDSVLFLDDFRGDELGEFPARWRLTEGTFEVVEAERERWLRSLGSGGAVRMKVPAGLPEFWTLEFDFVNEERGAIALTVTGFTKDGDRPWQALFPYSSQNLAFHCGSITANTPFEGTATGRHHIALMARGTALKMYVDQQRMVSVPDVTGPGVTSELELRFASASKPMIGNVRFAAGPRPAKDLLAEGRLVTHGIRFATGSDVVLPESAPILRQVAAWMEANPSARLKVTGHTDNVGTAADNLDLSRRRAASVAKVLSTEFAVAADRLDTDGKGDTQAMSSNAKPEGRAMNRRVEFSKV